MPSQQINGFSMHYREQGSGEPVVLMHGFPLSSQIFESQIDVLSRHFRVIAPDLRGFGQSPSSDRFTVNSLADDVHTLLSRIGALPCILGGLSMGGYVAEAFIRKHPGDVKKLILLNTKADADAPPAREGRNKMIELCRKSGSAGVAKEMLPKMLSPATIERNDAVVDKVIKLMESQPAKTIEHALEALRDRDDQTQLLPNIKVPTLIISGDGDQITGPLIAEPMQKAIPGSKLVIIPRAGHLSTMENPLAVNEALLNFLQASSR
jgi:pimeloyl-ACP methyl ester carboxylesterase